METCSPSRAVGVAERVFLRCANDFSSSAIAASRLT